MADVFLIIEKNRATLTGSLGNVLLQLSASLEGQKRWLKTGGFSFEPTPMNMERFRAAYPSAVIEGTAVPDVFENWSPTTAVARGSYQFKTQPYPFQFRALARSAGWVPPDQPGGQNSPFLIQDLAHFSGQGLSQVPALAGPARIPAFGHRAQPAPEPTGLSGAIMRGEVLPPIAQLGVPARVFAVLGEVGTGKTKILIDTAGILWCAGLIDAMVILSPKGVHAQWIEEQMPLHLNIPWHGTIIDGKKKLPDFWLRDQLPIISANIDYPSRTKDGMNVLMQFIENFNGRVLFIVDESHHIKSFGSNRTDAAIRLGEACAFKRIATGTPLSLNLLDAFSQYYFLDEAIFGQRYTVSFKNEYCTMIGSGADEKIIGHKNVEQFWERIAPYTFRITKDEADLNLPPQNYARHPFELSVEQRHHYTAMKQDMIARMDNGELIAPTNVMTQMLRLQQITCGWLIGEDDVKQPLNNARIDALKEVISQREGKIAIWARFTDDIRVIKELLGDEAVTYMGETSDNDRKSAKERFLDPNSNVRYFISNPAAGGVGLNLQGECRTVIYYSNSFNAIDRWQSEGRFHRIGAKGAITYIDLVARGTLDTKILANLRDKKSISDLAFDDIRKIVEA